MRFPHHARMSITRRDEKELRLTAFIARGLAMLKADPAAAQSGIAAVARSAKSPVVRSIAACAREIAAVGAALRLMLARTDAQAQSAALAALCEAGVSCDVRLACNPRLIEAHEQLTIGGRVAWIGDTMRRDPAICDAYESYVEDCPEIAAGTETTFRRLWRDCVPLAEHPFMQTIRGSDGSAFPSSRSW